MASVMAPIAPSTPAWADCHQSSAGASVSAIALMVAGDAGSIDPDDEAPQPDPSESSPVITPADLRAKTPQEIKDLAERLGLKPFGSSDNKRAEIFGKPFKWRDPRTGNQRLRLDPGHQKPTGEPFDDPRAAVAHVHGYDELGSRIFDDDCDKPNPHFPLSDPPTQTAEEEGPGETAAEATASRTGMPVITPPSQTTDDTKVGRWAVSAPMSNAGPHSLALNFGDGAYETRTVPQGVGGTTFQFSHTFAWSGTYFQTATIIETGSTSEVAVTVAGGVSALAAAAAPTAKAPPFVGPCLSSFEVYSVVEIKAGSRTSGCRAGISPALASLEMEPEPESSSPSSPESHGGNVHCNDLITGSVALTGNVVDAAGLPCIGNGVRMASNATLDLNGYKILGQTIAAGGDEAGIVFKGVTGATVTDSSAVLQGGRWVSTNAVSGFDAGIAIIKDTLTSTASSGNTIEKVNVIGNVGLDGDYGEGIHIRDSGSNTISDNTVVANGFLAGITLLDDSDANVVTDNLVVNNRDPYPATVDPEDIGIRLEVSRLATAQCPDDNVLVHNTVRGNSLDGISVMNGYNCDSKDNQIAYNTVSGNGRDGIRLNARQFATTASTVKGALRTQVHHNTVTDNGAAGIRLTSFVEDSDIYDNVVVGNNPIVVLDPIGVHPPHGDLHDGNRDCTSNVTGGVSNTWTNNTHVSEYAGPGSATALLPTDFTCVK